MQKKDYINGYLGVYEMTCLERLRDMFIWAYEGSVKEYLAIRKSTIVKPDPLYLKYQASLHAVIRHIVTHNIQASLPIIERAAQDTQHPQAFKDMVMDGLKHLHVRLLARYQINWVDFEQWKK